MVYKIEILDAPKRVITRLVQSDRKIAEQIDTKIRSLAFDPHPPGCTRLKGRHDWRVRVRHWRIIYEIHDDVLVVKVLQVVKRDEKTYKN